uniref:Uncharacterized protein n=1 Tax=Arundo donax TaxID=35708 RepID=A0A0A9GV28_ARUDO
MKMLAQHVQGLQM